MRFMYAFRGQALFARALRGSALTAGSYAIAQGLRLASNMILARLLFPEAFGLMALVTVVLVGLMMFSDAGIAQSIARSPQGDDPDFLDTAWSLQVTRGVVLWLVSIALAWPMSWFYDAPLLMQILPVAGVSLLVAGFDPTRIYTADRHLLLGRVTALDLLSQVIGLVLMVVLAAWTGSVWALVVGAVITALSRLILMWQGLPGQRNRLRWNPEAASELLHFGKWIFLSTACGFLLAQGDKLILGSYLSLDRLGIYNIGYFLASFPLFLGLAVVSRVMIPLYRDDPPGAKAENAPRLAWLRMAMAGGLLAMLGILAFGGELLVALLYDDRYAMAGAVVVLVACAQMPAVIGLTYDQAALAAGDARNFFFVLLVKALAQTGAFLIGAELDGLRGALVGQGLALVVIHPLIIWLARKHDVWDARHDLTWSLVALLLIVAAVMTHAEQISSL